MPESVTDRPTKAHEFVFLLTKSGTATYWVNGRRGTLSATKPAPDYWWVHPESQEASETPVEGWKRENAWRGRDYWFDQEAVREPHSPDGRIKTVHDHQTDSSHPNYDNVGKGNERWPNGGRNIRSVWEIATQPYAEAHFATYPEELVRRCLLAGCPEWVCGSCGKPRERIVGRLATGFDGSKYGERAVEATGGAKSGGTARSTLGSGGGKLTADHETIGWSDCGHNNYRPGVVP